MKTVLSFLLVLVLLQMVSNSAHAFGLKRGSSGSVAATPTPSSPPVTSSPGSLLPNGAPSCTSTDTAHICLGLKLVSYTQNGATDLNLAQAITLVNGITKVWSQCNIGFQLETYEAVDPTTLGLAFNTNWKNDGDTVRSTFNDHGTFLVVSVGSLSGSTIAVTEMPGAGVYGTLVEKAYAQNPLTTGHELGHYQGLYHISDSSNLMNPYIGPNTATLTASQCATARSTDYANWQTMMRYPK